MKLKILIGMIILLLIVGCSSEYKGIDQQISDTFTPQCENICTSHNWEYSKFVSRGWGSVICYCIDSDNAIWTFSI